MHVHGQKYALFFGFMARNHFCLQSSYGCTSHLLEINDGRESGLRLAREKQVNVSVIPTSHGID
jgi:hypothetical protein